MKLKKIMDELQPNPYTRYDLNSYITKDTDMKTIYFYNDGYREYRYGQIYSYAHRSNQMKYFPSLGIFKDYREYNTSKVIPEVLFTRPNYIAVRQNDYFIYIYPTDIYVQLYKEDDYKATVIQSPDGYTEYTYVTDKWSKQGNQQVEADHTEEEFFQMGTVTEVLYKIEEAQITLHNIHNNLRKTQ